jgi:hypothetical protein
MCQRPEVRITLLREVEVLELAVVHRIDSLALPQVVDQIHDQRHGLDCSHIVLGRQDVQCRHVLSEQLGLLYCELGPIDSGGAGTLQ